MPPFTESSYLPPGIWIVSWADFWEQYGYNSRRANLLSGLMFALKLLVRSNCQTIYIGGSFITSKERPNDTALSSIVKYNFPRSELRTPNSQLQ